MRALCYGLLACLFFSCNPLVKSSLTQKGKGSPDRAPFVWSTVATQGQFTARHEAAFVAVDNRAYLLGGRGVKPVDSYDPTTRSWAVGDSSPVEIHHFQPVVHAGEIYAAGAMNGRYPGEVPLPDIYIYNPQTNRWRKGAEIPADRRRGAAGAVVHEGVIYLVCGIQDGHRGGHVAWLDAYDIATGVWTRLPDAPRPRDHFQAAVHEGKIYAAGGRTTIAAQGPFANTIREVDVYDIATRQWQTLTEPLPTPRAGTAAICWQDELLIIGGESMAHKVAHHEVEALHLATGLWSARDTLSRGRHGTGVVLLEGQLIMASGCGQRGGKPELQDVIACSVE